MLPSKGRSIQSSGLPKGQKEKCSILHKIWFRSLWPYNCKFGHPGGGGAGRAKKLSMISVCGTHTHGIFRVPKTTNVYVDVLLPRASSFSVGHMWLHKELLHHGFLNSHEPESEHVSIPGGLEPRRKKQHYSVYLIYMICPN